MKWAIVEKGIVKNIVVAGKSKKGLRKVNDWVNINQHVDTPYPEEAALTEDLLNKIADLGSKITNRMRDEAAIGSTLTGLGEDGSMTAAQYITHVLDQIAALRAQLPS